MLMCEMRDRCVTWLIDAASPVQGANCCAELRALLDAGPDGGDCPPAGPCRGFVGSCADLPTQFEAVPVLPDFPNGLSDYVCRAFPNGDAPVDSFIVGLISIAVALPVALFLAAAFEMANDSDAPESWLMYSGWIKFVFGFHAHRRWHYTGPAGQPVRFVRWHIRSVTAPLPETLLNLCTSVKCFLTGAEPPWTVEAREAEEAAALEEEEEEAAAGSEEVAGCAAAADDTADLPDSFHVAAVADARANSAYKRALTWAGLCATLLTWAIFAWFIFVRAPLVMMRSARPSLRTLQALTQHVVPSPRRRRTGCSSTSCSARRRRATLRARGVRCRCCRQRAALCTAAVGCTWRCMHAPTAGSRHAPHALQAFRTPCTLRRSGATS